jgi:hypothetical protein
LEKVPTQCVANPKVGTNVDKTQNHCHLPKRKKKIDAKPKSIIQSTTTNIMGTQPNPIFATTTRQEAKPIVSWTIRTVHRNTCMCRHVE